MGSASEVAERRLLPLTLATSGRWTGLSDWLCWWDIDWTNGPVDEVAMLRVEAEDDEDEGKVGGCIIEGLELCDVTVRALLALTTGGSTLWVDPIVTD
jgi:hypothetical protein